MKLPQGVEHEFSLGDRQPSLDHEHPSVLPPVQPAPVVRLAGLLELLGRLPVAARKPIELRSRAVLGHLEQRGLELRRRDPCERADLRVAQPARAELRAYRRNAGQRVGDPQLLPGGHG